MLQTRTRHYLATILASVLLLALGVAYAGEHPQEHPSEHPSEHPAMGQTRQVTKDDIAEAVTRYVTEDSELKGGYFLFYDAAADAPLALRLEKVHRERLSHVGPNLYFVCADFATQGGRVYDLDIFMEGPAPDQLEVTEITVHKEQGQPRYTWFEQGGTWHRKQVR